jgi:hypothetical protein
MAKATGLPVRAVQEKAAWDDVELRELAARLEDLARAQDEARGAVGDDEASHAAAFEQLFAAVARLNPRRGAGVIRTRAQSAAT